VDSVRGMRLCKRGPAAGHGPSWNSNGIWDSGTATLAEGGFCHEMLPDPRDARVTPVMPVIPPPPDPVPPVPNAIS
jgi:hypothetical protein